MDADYLTVPTSDGRQISVRVSGTGAPTVVFESGMGGSHWQWAAVQPLVAAHTRTASYDRSGLGDSDPDPTSRSLSRAVDDLEDVLQWLGDGPFVLVGHSWGGPIVRTLASRRPRVQGLVLVDPTDERCDLYFAKGPRRAQRVLNIVQPSLARLGLIKLGLRRLGRQLPSGVRDAMADADGSVAAARGMQAEYRSLEDDMLALRNTPPNIGTIPTTIISGTKPTRAGGRARRSLAEAHVSSAAALTAGRHVRAHQSNHFVHFTEPDVVAEEIRRLIGGTGLTGN